jgi:tetratricopeptide (TPR) repeat protein
MRCFARSRGIKRQRIEKTMMLTRTFGSILLAGLISAGVAERQGFPEPGATNVPELIKSEALEPLHAPPETPAAAAPRKKSEKIRLWCAGAAQHVPGKPDAAAVAIAGWTDKDLDVAISYVTKLASQPPKSARRTLARASIRRILGLTNQEAQQADLSRILKQGALLHTDIALLGLNAGRYQNADQGMAVFADGRVFIYPKTFHWALARKLVDLVASRRPQDPAIKQWYIATTAHMQSRGLLGYAGTNLEYALERFPSDNRILFYAGVLHEAWASPANQVPLPQGASVSYGSKESELKQAQQFFRKALADNPGFSELHLHLGRVTGLLGQHDQAVAELQLAAASIKDPQLLYFDSLYLGYEFEMLCRRNEALAQYERAAMLFPNAQSPLLALSQLAHSENDVQGASLALQRVFALPRSDPWRADPWWTYNVSHVRDAARQVEEMYRMFGGIQR